MESSLYMRGFYLLTLCGIFLCPVIAQNSRTEEIQRARQQRTPELHPEDVSKTERFLRTLKDDRFLERLANGFNGFGVKLGGMVTGGGFGVGPQYLREDLLHGNMRFRSSAQISTRNYRKYDLEWGLPRLASGRAFLNIFGTHHNYPGIQYYGPGPDSSKDLRTNYRLEDTALDGTLGIRPRKFVLVGASVGSLWVNVGPGTDSRFASADQVFTPEQAPGIDRQSNFTRFGTFAQFDYRDNPGTPRRGGNYVIQHSIFSDRELDRHDFRRLDIDLEQYIGLPNRARILALRGRAILTYPGSNDVVPFYLQPILGGSDDLRGFRAFRFSGNNSLVLNAEYRWESFSGLDLALFVDGGKVFPKPGHLNFANLEASGGFGLRFNVRNQTFFRIDIGFSREGFQAWFKFNDVFVKRPFGTSSSQPVY
jgi:outer membrane protein assembly factor BamA